MRIPKDLPQFRTHRALLIIVDKQEAKLYLAHDGNITCVAVFFVPTPRFFDHDGYSLRRGAGGDSSEFLQIMERSLQNIFATETPTRIFLFSLPSMRDAIMDLLPRSLFKATDWIESGATANPLDSLYMSAKINT